MSNCVADHAQPATATVGRLCQGHAAGLRDDLCALSGVYDALAYVLVREVVSGVPVTSSRTPGLSLDLAAFRARDLIHAELHSWTRVTLEEGPWQHAPADSVTAMAAWLRVRVPWLAGRDYADAVCRDISTAVSQGRAAIQPDRVRRVELGFRCPERLTDEDGTDRGACPGVLLALIHDLDSLLPSEVVCTGTPTHSWGAAQWRALGRRVSRVGYAEVLRRVAVASA